MFSVKYSWILIISHYIQIINKNEVQQEKERDRRCIYFENIHILFGQSREII
jgi:hypothetical protein